VLVTWTDPKGVDHEVAPAVKSALEKPYRGQKMTGSAKKAKPEQQVRVVERVKVVEKVVHASKDDETAAWRSGFASAMLVVLVALAARFLLVGIMG
jgi:hypothetical protein